MIFFVYKCSFFLYNSNFSHGGICEPLTIDRTYALLKKMDWTQRSHPNTDSNPAQNELEPSQPSPPPHHSHPPFGRAPTVATQGGSAATRVRSCPPSVAPARLCDPLGGLESCRLLHQQDVRSHRAGLPRLTPCSTNTDAGPRPPAGRAPSATSNRLLPSGFRPHDAIPFPQAEVTSIHFWALRSELFG